MDSKEDSPLLLNGSHQPGYGKLTPYLLFVAIVAVIGGFNYGYHIGVINNPRMIITNCTETENGNLGLPPCFSIDDALWGTIVGIFAIGGLVGGIVAGWLADKYGRTIVMMGNNFFFILGSLLLGFSVSPTMLAIARVVVGVGAGISTVVMPMYLGEISPTNYRGAIGVFGQLAITTGIFVSQFMGLYMSVVPTWRWLLSFTLFTAILQLGLLVFCVHTPRWLIMKGRNEEAKVAILKLKGKNAVAEAEADYEYLLEGQANAENSTTLSFLELIKSKDLRKPLIIALTLQIAQQFSGINAVFYYSTDIFKRSNPDIADILTTAVGFWNVSLTILSVFLMDKAGRRVLLMFGEIGMSITGVLYTIAFALQDTANVSWLATTCTFLYVSFFAVGLGSIPFLILAEIFPTNAIGTAASIALPLNWICNYFVGQFFPIMSDGLDDYVFLPFTAIMVIMLLFTLKYVPETKGRTLESISMDFKK